MSEHLTIGRIFDGGSLAGPAPRELKVSPDSRRVTFLRAKSDDQFQWDLWEYRIDSGQCQLLVDSTLLQAADAVSSPAEQARRERQRTAAMRGILSYQWSPDGTQLLFPLDGALYRHAPDTASAPQRLALPDEALDARISPGGRYVAYLQGQNLWVLDLLDDSLRQLTHDGGGTVFNGEAEFVAQEEMGRPYGYWWSPDDEHLAFERYDEKEVAITGRIDVHSDSVEVVPQRYPFAGQANVAVALGIVALADGQVRWIDLGDDADIYLTRVDWLPDGKALSYQRMRRNQRQLDLQWVALASLQQRTLLSETDARWINLNDDLRFLADGRFIWGSERSGYHQLYLHDAQGTLLHAIGAGEWGIDGVLAVDAMQELVYVSSNRDFVPERQIYALRLDGSTANQPLRISQGRGTHQAQFADDASFYVDTYASVSTPPQVSVHAPDGRRLAWIERNALDEHHPAWRYLADLPTPQFGSLPASDGQALFYRLYMPVDFDPSRRYPVFNAYYGGPHAQVVVDTWGDYFNQYMASRGFVVFSLDNRGMARRGRQFENAIHGQLGSVEVDDQLAGIAWLKRQPWVDARRIGVFGWSYGGYLTCMLLAKGSDEVAGGVAVAPVTDWAFYDTFYTERYLGLPQDNSDGYALSSPLAWIERLTARLCLVHGMADDNVLFLNSTRLMAALQRHGTHFELMTYPGGKHGLAGPGQRSHVHHLIEAFFRRQIKGVQDEDVGAQR